MSLLYSAIRIIPTTTRMTLRRIAYASAILFGCMWLSIIADKLFICIHDTSWEMAKNPQCHLGFSVGILELVSKYIHRHWKRSG